MNWIALSAERLDVVRDDCGVPLEWTLLKTGSNPICQDGIDGAINLTAENMQQIISYHHKKGEDIPLDSEHYLYKLAKHNAGEVPHTSKFKPWKVEAYFAFETKEKATAFEAYLKTGSGHAFAKRHF